MPVDFGTNGIGDPILSAIMASNEPQYDHLIARQALHHVGVDPTFYRGGVEVLTSRPRQGQGHQLNLNRGDLDPYTELSSAKDSLILYRCKEISGKRTIGLKKYRRSKNKERLKQQQVAIPRSAVRLEEELKVAILLFTAGNWGANTKDLVDLVGGSGKKAGVAEAKEFSDLALAKELAAKTAYGRQPEILTIGNDYFEALRRAIEWKAYGSTQRDRIVNPVDETIALIKSVTGVDEVLVGRAMAESAAIGAASAPQRIWGPHAAFYWRTTDAVADGGDIAATPATALGIYEELEGGSDDGYAGYEWTSEDPPALKIAGALCRDQVFLQETDTTLETPALMDPRGFLVTNGV